MTESNQDAAAIDAENRLMRDLQDDQEIPAWYYNNDVYTVIRDDDQALVVRDTGLHELNELEREYPDTDVRGLMHRLADKYAPETDWCNRIQSSSNTTLTATRTNHHTQQSKNSSSTGTTSRNSQSKT